MFRRSALTLLMVSLSATAHAETITSAYTNIDAEKTCQILKQAEDGEGDWVDYECEGYRGHKVYLSYGDLRESVDYGYPAPKLYWESFSAFNSSGQTIEWRLDDGTPIATIHRWHVSASSSDGTAQDQILVIETVGQKEKPGGCAVGYVRATGNAKANEQAREIADQKARAFVCGDTPTTIGDIPEFSRQPVDN